MRAKNQKRITHQAHRLRPDGWASPTMGRGDSAGARYAGEMPAAIRKSGKPERQSLRALWFVSRIDGQCKASQSTDTRQAPSMRVFVESQ